MGCGRISSLTTGEGNGTGLSRVIRLGAATEGPPERLPDLGELEGVQDGVHHTVQVARCGYVPQDHLLFVVI